MPLVQSFSGIRGIYDDGLDEKVAARYAFSYLSLLKLKNKNSVKIIIGTDTRNSRDILKNAVIEVLDCEIIEIGIASTPMVEFAVRYFKADGGIIITASHNEPYWNGFKFLDKDGAVLRPKDMDWVIRKYKELKKYNEIKNNNNKNKNQKKIIKRYNEINQAYTGYVLNFLTREDKNKIKNSKIRIIIDPNGGTGIIAKEILERLHVKVHAINMKRGIFNHIIEPNEDSLLYLTNDVREKKYDFAAGFDCDADRVEVITGKGLVSGNKLLALIADEILSKAKNKIIVVNDATSLVVKEIANNNKAKYIETGVGEINVVDKIFESKAPVGGEGSSSGVIIPPSRCRDGILTLIYLLKIIANNKKTLDELIKTLPEYYNIKRNVNIDSNKYNKIKKKLIDYYRKKQCNIKESIKTSSLKVLMDNSFVWFRVSRTEANVLRIITDSKNKKKAELLMNEALNLVKNK